MTNGYIVYLFKLYLIKRRDIGTNGGNTTIFIDMSRGIFHNDEDALAATTQLFRGEMWDEEYD
jgi:hypothetical protein